MARYLKSHKKGMEWYRDELLEKAKDIGYRLLPAFNTTTGMPYPRVSIIIIIIIITTTTTTTTTTIVLIIIIIIIFFMFT